MSMTQAEFDALLTWLDPDRDRAGEKYEKIRSRLIKIFACRGCSEPEDQADQTFNRVASKLEEILGTWVGDPTPYFYNVAQKILLEYFRKRKVPTPPVENRVDENIEKQYACLEECMTGLHPEDRRLVTEYYQDEKAQKIRRRNRLAEEFGITLNALRIKACRIRQQLRLCVLQCL